LVRVAFILIVTEVGDEIAGPWVVGSLALGDSDRFDPEVY
jgi:hypothetical protein